ncbi:MAG: DUF4124 domain-containing protein [Geobacter sp.]|nr:DUF4124 domain-containing protein [Geobacter sp.]
MRASVLIAVLMTVIMAVPSMAAIYTWEDERGVVNFAEDYGKIPQKFRKKARIVGEDSADETLESESSAPNVKEKPRTSDGLPKEVSPAASDSRKVFGGKDERVWQQEFAMLKAELKSIQDQIDAVNARLAKSDQMSRSEYRILENTRKLLEEQQLAAKNRFEKLSADAQKAGVPPDLR